MAAEILCTMRRRTNFRTSLGAIESQGKSAQSEARVPNCSRWCMLGPMPCLSFLGCSDPKLRIGCRYKALVTTSFAILGTSLASTHLAAQWLKYPTPGVPRKDDGSVDMAAPTPRLA